MPDTCQWCDEAPATLHGFDDHNGPVQSCTACHALGHMNAHEQASACWCGTEEASDA